MLYYHYTSTRNAAGIRQGGKLKKIHRNIVLTTLQPQDYNRDQILCQIYGYGYDKHQFGNRADWVVVVHSSKINPNKLIRKSNAVYEYPEDINVGYNDVMDKPRCTSQSFGSSQPFGSSQWFNGNEPKAELYNNENSGYSSTPSNGQVNASRFYYYTSTKNAQTIRSNRLIPKGNQNIILTTLEPENYFRDQILNKIYGNNYDRHQFANTADWVVVVNSSKLDSSKLRKKSDGIYEYFESIRVDGNDVMDKPRCTSRSSTASDGQILYHYTDRKGADAIKAAGFIKKSGQSGAFGAGTYMTDLKPDDFFRDDILKNNYGGISNAFKGRADYVVNVHKNKLNLQKLHKVGTAVTGRDRSIYLYEDPITVSANDVYDKPKSRRAR